MQKQVQIVYQLIHTGLVIVQCHEVIDDIFTDIV